jgi:hypothetical protein
MAQKTESSDGPELKWHYELAAEGVHNSDVMSWMSVNANLWAYTGRRSHLQQ